MILILKGIDDEHAGVYRKENVIISGATHIPPHFLQVHDDMQQLMVRYGYIQEHMHAVERSAFLHAEFVNIHPFVDGNGRTARLLLNFELMKHGYPPIVIEREERAVYYAALDFAHTTGDIAPFTQLVMTALNRTLDLYLKLLD
ncbi:MAG: Filamentation induced by cAMP protein Fic [Paenibacillus sp.]|jgi:Fic family protein|nr:Filamentation induced by cAMP protein Fic [Paenibacillus sp.]